MLRKLACVALEKNVTEFFLYKFLVSKIFQVPSNRKWTCSRFKILLFDEVLHTDGLCQISENWSVVPDKNLRDIVLFTFFYIIKYSEF